MTTACIVLKQERLAHLIKRNWKRNCNECHKNVPWKLVAIFINF